MAKLPSLKRLQTEDIQNAPNWIQRILITINSFFQNVFAALDNGLTFEENFDAKVVEISIIGGETVTVASPFSRPVEGILLLQVSGDGITGGVTPLWRQIEQDIEITGLTGVTSGNLYTAKLLVL